MTILAIAGIGGVSAIHGVVALTSKNRAPVSLTARSTSDRISMFCLPAEFRQTIQDYSSSEVLSADDRTKDQHERSFTNASQIS
jgi:hypothetical protein